MPPSSAFDRHLVTAALPYANGPLHIGHLAGAYLPADVHCRYLRLKGRDLVFICGSDEHGVPIIMRARAEGVSPQDVVDRYHALMERTFRDVGMSFDYYGRTSSRMHHETSRAFFTKVAERGGFVVKSESQLFDPEAGMFLADRFVRGTCPQCGNENAYGDQCENCGRTLSPRELIAPRSAITNATPELRETSHWYYPLGAMQPKLEAWLATHPEWKPNVVGQVKSWLAEGLGDRAMTRDLPWGVPVPEDVAKAAGVDASGKVLYVWFDAPIGYVSATREWAEKTGEPEAWKRYWQDERSRLVHFIGKDNIVFHTLIFPALLMSHGDFVLPDDVPANEFMNLERQKISTSRNWAVWVHEFIERFPPDYLRYAIARILPESRDADFSFQDFQAQINAELADTLGNFVNRSLSFAVRFEGGVVPPLAKPTDIDREMLAAIPATFERVGDLLEAFRVRDAVQEAMGLARAANKYFNDAAPWATKKTDPDACATTLHVALQVSASLSVLLEPFLPFSAAKMRAMLGVEGVRASSPAPLDAPRARADGLGWDEAAKTLLLTTGARLGTPEILFRKLETSEIEAEQARLGAPSLGATTDAPAKPATPPKPATKELRVNDPETGTPTHHGASSTASSDPRAPEPDAAFAEQKALIEYDDFAKLDLRVGRVLTVERVPKSKKLLRCEVDVGFEKRQILAGIGEKIAPESLLDASVVIVANLAPRKMMGLESQGMILAATARDGSLVPVTAPIEPGATVS